MTLLLLLLPRQTARITLRDPIIRTIGWSRAVLESCPSASARASSRKIAFSSLLRPLCGVHEVRVLTHRKT